MYKALVACRVGIGSSLMLKIKAETVIKNNNLPITIEHASLDAVPNFNGDVIITLSDVADELRERNLPQDIIGITNIIDQNEILTKLTEYLEKKGA